MYKYFKDSEVKGLDPKLCQMLDQARDIAGIPFIITSGLRSPTKDKELGGTGDGAHTKGLAVDLRCQDSRSRFLILKALFQIGFFRIGDEIDHIHADIDLDLDVNVCWRE